MRVRLLTAVVAICCSTALQAQKKDPYKRVDNDVRLAALRQSQVWMPGDISSRDIRLGPQEKNGFKPGAVVNCEYVEEKHTGTPKFDCALGPDDTVRVKYGEANGEIYSEVAA